MILFLYSILLCTFAVLADNSSFSPTLAQLTYTTQKISDIPQTQQLHFSMSEYFFSRLPQAELPEKFLTELRAYYAPLLQPANSSIPILPPVFANQTAQERAAQVMNHIEKFYGLLYTTVLFEKGIVTPGNFNKNAPPELTFDDIYNSHIWQSYLKITVTEAYDKEHNYLTQLYSNNQEVFKYLPDFELSYYNKKFTNLRNSSELTRLYLMLSEAVRERLSLLITDFSNFSSLPSQTTAPSQEAIIFQTNLPQLKAIEDFKKDDFFKNIDKLKNIALSQTFPIAFNDINGDPISFTDALKQYDFSTYFSYADTEKTIPKVTSEFELFFTISQDATTQEYNCYFTGLGHAVFAQPATETGPGFPYGNITYKTFKLPHGKTRTKGYFTTTKMYHLLFNGEPPQPTFGFFCFLTVTSIKYLHVDFTPLFANEYLENSLTTIENNRISSPTFPSAINYSLDDYILLKKINDIYKDLQIDSTQIASATPQSSSWGHAIRRGFDDFGDSIAMAGEAFIDHTVVGRFLRKIGLTIADAAVKFADDTVDAAKSFGDAVLSAGFAIADEATALYYTSCIFPMIASGFTMSVSDCLQDAAEYQHAVTKHLTACMEDLNATITDLGKAYEDVAFAEISIIGQCVSVINKRMGQDLAGALRTVVDMSVGYAVAKANLIIDTISEGIILTADAVQMIASVAAVVITGNAFNSNAWEAVGESGLHLVQDTISALLVGVKLALHFAKRELEDAMLAFSYVISFITQAITVTCAALAAAGDFLYTFLTTANLNAAADAASSTYWNAYHAIAKYSIIISSIVGIAVLIAATVITGGADIELTGPMMAMMLLNVGMSVMSIAGSVQNNLTAIQKQDRQEKTVDTYRQYVIDNFSVAQGLIANRGVESLVQYKMTQDNSERSLLFYHNNYNQQINNSISQQAYSVGTYVQNLATPNWNLYNSPENGSTLYPYDTTVAVQGDLGQLYGFNTGRLSLSPSNGFALYNPGRDTFSQEALVDPIIIPTQAAQSTLSGKEQLETFWFQQKDLTFLPLGAALEGDVLWRVTAQRETPFHIGVYLTERAIDLGILQTFYNNYQNAINGSTTISFDTFQSIWKPFDTYNKYIFDFDKSAKIFVLERNPLKSNTIEQNNKTKLGVYVVDSEQYENNWAPVTFTPSTFSGTVDFKKGIWYRMKASLNNGNMTVAFWEIGDDKAYEKIVQNPENSGAPLAQAIVPVEKATYPDAVINLKNIYSAINNIDNIDKYAGSMGFVTSGAAVEYKVLIPAPAITKTPIRKSEYTNLINTVFANSKPMEKDREIAWKQTVTKALKPQFGNFALSAIDEINIITGMFIYYNTSSTPRDIITFFTQNQNGAYLLNANPGNTVQGIVSLATGLTYNSSGAITGFIPNVCTLYEKQYAAIPAQCNSEISTMQKHFLQSLQTPLTFANNTMKLIDTSDPSIFIYQGTSLLTSNIPDFYVTASVNNAGVTEYGLPFLSNNSHNTINAFISITSGMIYYLETNNQNNSPLLPAPSLTPTLLNTLSLVNSNSTYTLYNTYKKHFTGSLAPLLAKAYQAYQTYEATLAKEAAFENQLTNAINQATAAASNANTQANLAQMSNPQVAQTATTAATNATTAATGLQNFLNEYKQAIASNNTAQINAIYTLAQQQLQTATTATTNANNAATAAQNAINQNSSGFNFGGSSSGSSNPSNSSSFSNFNSNFGSSDSFSNSDTSDDSSTSASSFSF